MKLILPLLLLFPSLLFAEPSPRTPRILSPTDSGITALPENYQITLQLIGRETSPIEICLAVGSPAFRALFEEHGIEFSGSLELAAGNTVLLNWTLSWETHLNSGTSTLIKKSSAHGTVRLDLGKPVVLYRMGKQSANVAIQRLESSTP
jgi:hypothetical protein